MVFRRLFNPSSPFSCVLLAILLSASPASGQDDIPAGDDDDFFIFDEEEDSGPLISDPFEPFNRTMFELNDTLYRSIVKPVAVFYRNVPRPVRVSVGNFFNNIATPVSALNALLQGDLENTGTELARFGINSTIGVLGLFDAASDMNIVRDHEDLGQTMGRWGIGHGFYLVIPFVGPTSLRNMVGRAGDMAANPFYQNLNGGEIFAANLAEAENRLSLDEDTYEAFYESALDPYIFFRSSFAQNRSGQIDQ